MKKQFKKYKYTVLFGLTIFVFTMVLWRIENYPIKTSLFSAVFSLLVFFIIYDFISKIKYNLWILLPLSFMISVDFIYLLCYSTSLYPANIEAILLTNKTEILDVTRKVIFPSLIVLPLTIFLSLKTVKELKKTPLRLDVYILLFMAIGYFTASYYIKNNGKVNKVSFNLRETFSQKSPLVFKNIENVFAYIDYKNEATKYLSKPRSLPDGMFLHEDKNAEKPLKVFYIIGESSYRGHYSVYGYDTNTTPFLKKLKKQNDIHCFENVISPASITTLSIKNTLSFSTPNDQSKINDYYNLIELANLVGYETIWISNNGQKIGIHDSEVIFIANSSAQTEIIFNKTSDLMLIPILKEKIIRDKPQFFIIHLNGNHGPYWFDDVDTKALGNKGKTINYDKSLHYTDRVLREIYKVMKTTDDTSLFYYFADHGELINKGHSFLDFSEEAEKQFQIPLILATNKIAKEPIQNIVESYRDKETGLLNHLNSIGIISEIIGYSFSKEFKQENIEEGKYIYNVNYKAYKYKEIYPYP